MLAQCSRRRGFRIPTRNAIANLSSVTLFVITQAAYVLILRVTVLSGFADNDPSIRILNIDVARIRASPRRLTII